MIKAVQPRHSIGLQENAEAQSKGRVQLRELQQAALAEHTTIMASSALSATSCEMDWIDCFTAKPVLVLNVLR
jgi:hypothetical protein